RIPRRIAHAGRTVVDDHAAVEDTQPGRARVAAGEDFDTGSGKTSLDPVAPGRIVQPGRIEAPAGERIRVAMHDTHRQRPDPPAREHRQAVERGDDLRMPGCGGLEPRVDAVGTRYRLRV